METILPLKEYVFDRKKFIADLKGEKKFLREDEDVDKDGHKGHFKMTAEFQLILLSDMSDPDFDDELVQMCLDQIDHIENFHIVFIFYQRKMFDSYQKLYFNIYR